MYGLETGPRRRRRSAPARRSVSVGVGVDGPPQPASARPASSAAGAARVTRSRRLPRPAAAGARRAARRRRRSSSRRRARRPPPSSASGASHDELRAVGVLAQQACEAADVRVVERGLDLVEEVERARPREEEAEEERDRAERLLAARQQRQPRDALADRAQLDLDPRLLALVLGLGEAQPSLAAGEQGRRDLGEVLLDRGEGLLEAALDRLGEVAAELLELLEAALEVGALGRQLVEPLLLGLVLLLARAG